MEMISKEILSDLVYEQIVKMLLNKDLKPGEKVQKKELAAMLDVSLTPVTEALNRLINEGIIEQRERRELYVKVFTNKDMIELFEVRAGLEGTALHICMEKLNDKEWGRILTLFDEFSLPVPESKYKRYQKKDQEFHSSILKMSGNQLILDFISRCEFIIRCYQQGLIRPPEESLAEHMDIIKSIKDKDVHLAQKKLMEHHWRTRERLAQKDL
ncbi:MAG: GntR family transcriptional regulator [Spirochaetaceae bacterium]